MPDQFQDAFKAVKKLVQDFQASESYYLSSEYSESQARTDFIDKLFMALGWDVRHEQQKNPYEQEVKIEKEVKTALAQRRADYAFFVTPNYRDPRFYVEAKKPSRNLENAADYHQTTRYGWNKGTSIAVLTDFEEFHILDCRYKPDLDTALQRAIKSFRYKDYTNEEKFKEIYYLFSRAAVADGSLEKYAASLPKPKGKKRAPIKGQAQPVDEAFLAELDGYRETLAKAFKKSNPKLESDELTEIVQRTIDRLVFIRFLEDKQIEDPQMLSYRSKSRGDKPSAWAAFLAECRRLEPKYNGLVFRTHRIIDGPNFAPPDDTDFADICDELADETSPYNFELIPIEILGSIYERFLGKVVNATDKRVKVEEKPEVRKAGGVYYTPQYIVRYIIENTVGKILYEDSSPLLLGEGQGEVSSVKKQTPPQSSPKRGGGLKSFKLTPDQVAKLSFADIACGSGSFLIEVYNELIRFHELYYTQHPNKAKKGDTETRDGKIILSLKKRQEILTNNIYGVDIDWQATEVTQLSLYLKLLEDVTLSQTHMFKDKILPELKNNIVCGNSLIGRDILEGELFESEELKKLNPMDFENAFPEVMKRGGFDAVVGNPPYVLLQDDFGDKASLEYFRKNYSVASYKIDTYHLFIERGVRCLNEKGTIGLIVPSNFLTNNYLVSLRRFILDKTQIREINSIIESVFAGVSVNSAVFIFERNAKKTVAALLRSCSIKKGYLETVSEISFPQEELKNTKELLFTYSKSAKILDKIDNVSARLASIATVNFGMQLRDRKKFTTDVIEVKTKSDRVKLTKKHKECLTGRNITRYFTNYSNLYCLEDTKARKGGCWDLELHHKKNKIIVRQIGEYPICSLDDIGRNCLNTVFMVIPTDIISSHFLLGALNSKLMQFYWGERYYDQRETFPKIKGSYLLNLPIRTIDFTNPQDKSRHDKMVKLVYDMLKAKKELAVASMEQDIQRLERHCTALDRQIDALVYDLYDLTEEEIKIVEGK